MSRFLRPGSNKFSKLLLLPILVLAVLLKLTSSTSYIADAEFWVTNLSAKGFSVWESNPSLIFKPLFHFVLMFPKFITEHPERFVEFNRFLFFLIILATVYFVFRLSKEFFKDSFWALVTVLVLLFNTTYFFYSVQVRSDNLAILFHVLALLSLVKIQTLGFKKGLCLGLGFWALALLSTPKALLLVISGLPFVFATGVDVRKYLNKKALLGFIGVVSLGVVLILSVEAYQNAAMYFVRGFLNKANESVEYMSFRSFLYLKRSVSENWFFYVFFIVGLIWPIYVSLKPPKKSSLEKAIYASSLLLLVFFILIPDKLPFYLGSLMPVFALQVVVALRDLSQVSLRGVRLVVLAVGILAVSAQSYGFYLRHMHTQVINKNAQQKDFLKEFAAYLKNNPETTYFDGMGIVPNSQQYFQYIGYGQEETNKLVMAEVLKSQPDLILRTGRMIWVKHILKQTATQDYIELEGGYFALGSRFKTKSELSAILDENPKEQLWLCLSYKNKDLLDQIVKGNDLAEVNFHSDKCIGPINKTKLSEITLYHFDGYYLVMSANLALPKPAGDLAILFGLELN